MDKDRFRIGAIHINAITPVMAQERIIRAATSGKGGYICVSNMRMVRYAEKDQDYGQLMEQSLMNLPDGKPLTWLGKLWGLKQISCTNGPALFKAMLQARDARCRHYLLGDTEDVIADILRLNSEIYHADIVGAEALPFCNVRDFEYDAIAQRIRTSGANIVWTAMRAPKQDLFNRLLCRRIDSIVALGVGRAFRLLTGAVSDAPGWAQKCGFAGIFTRKVSLISALIWYFKTFFLLLAYSAQILTRKLRGIKYYD